MEKRFGPLGGIRRDLAFRPDAPALPHSGREVMSPLIRGAGVPLLDHRQPPPTERVQDTAVQVIRWKWLLRERQKAQQLGLTRAQDILGDAVWLD